MKGHCSNSETMGGEAISVSFYEKVCMLKALEVVGHHVTTTVPLRAVADLAYFVISSSVLAQEFSK